MVNFLQRLSGSLRARIVLYFLLAFLPAFVLFTITIELFLVPPVKKSIRNELTSSTRVLANAVRTSAAVAVRNHLRAIAERNLEIVQHHLSLVDQDVLSHAEAVERIRNILLSQKVGTSGYMYCLDSDGNVTVHPNSGVEGTNVSDFSFVQDQMRLKEGYVEYDWQNPGDESSRAKALYMVYLERLDWIISASSYRAEFDELLNPKDLRETVLSLRFGETGYAYVLDNDGSVLIHPKYDNYNILTQDEVSADFARTMFARRAGVLEYDWQNPDEKKSRRKIAVYETISEYGWLIVSSAYISEVMKPVWVARIMGHGSMALLLISAGLVSYYLSGRITRPLDKMMLQLDRNARNGVAEPLPVLTGDELGRLAREFNEFLGVVKKQNEAIRKQQLRYRSLFDSSIDAVFLLKGITIIDCNPATHRLFDVEDRSIIGLTVVDFSPAFQPSGESSLGLAKRISQSIGKNSLQTFEWVHCTATGRLFDAEVRLKTYGETKGRPLLIAFVRDITESKQAQNALKESELKYRQLIDNATDAIFIIKDEKIVFANNRTTEITGYDNEELQGLDLKDLIHPDELEVIMDRHRRRIKTGEDVPTYTFRFMNKDGTAVNAQLSAVMIEWNGGVATLNFLRDVTELKKMEVAFHEAQKMESIGTLAGGIAHDFNNILMGIQGRVSLLELTSSESERGEHLTAIERQVESATALTRQLLGFARGGKYDPRPMDIGTLLQNSAEMFGRTRKEVEIRIDIPDHTVVVEADKPQLEQVFLNLYVNGWQAMPEGGVMRLQVQVVEPPEIFCRSHGIDVGRYALVSVADSGCGMDESVRKQIFDPFFSTKDKELGTGLGLASVYGIVKNHNGVITVESELGIGSVFFIYLPISDKQPQQQIDRKDEIVMGNETILLIDDEQMILDVGRAMLEQLGYRIITAEGGNEAVEIMQSGRETIDLVILDLIMPELDGVKTLGKIRDLDEKLPVMLSSGYSVDDQAAALLKKGHCSDFIQKPFSLVKISGKIRDILDREKEKRR